MPLSVIGAGSVELNHELEVALDVGRWPVLSQGGGA